MDTDDNVALPSHIQPVIRVVPMPSDTNAAGDIFGGWIMSQVDMAGSIAALRRAKGRVVTVAVNSFVFHQPVFVGDLISCYADVTKVGNTSITVDVKVYAERQKSAETVVKVTEATVVFVAVDDNGKPRAVAG